MVNFPWDILNLKESASFVIRYVFHHVFDGAVLVYDFLMCLVWRAAGVASTFPSHLVWDGNVDAPPAAPPLLLSPRSDID